MSWVIFFIISFLIALFLVPIKLWEKLWPTGLIAMLVIFPIDNILASSNLFRFNNLILPVSNLPLFYWLAYFAGGIVVSYYRPPKRWWKIIFVVVLSFVYLLVELLMKSMGDFLYLNWRPLYSFIVNIGGFIIFLWLIDWLNSIIYIPYKFSQE